MESQLLSLSFTIFCCSRSFSVWQYFWRIYYIQRQGCFSSAELLSTPSSFSSFYQSSPILPWRLSKTAVYFCYILRTQRAYSSLVSFKFYSYCSLILLMEGLWVDEGAYEEALSCFSLNSCINRVHSLSSCSHRDLRVQFYWFNLLVYAAISAGSLDTSMSCFSSWSALLFLSDSCCWAVLSWSLSWLSSSWRRAYFFEGTLMLLFSITLIRHQFSILMTFSCFQRDLILAQHSWTLPVRSPRVEGSMRLIISFSYAMVWSLPRRSFSQSWVASGEESWSEEGQMRRWSWGWLQESGLFSWRQDRCFTRIFTINFIRYTTCLAYNCLMSQKQSILASVRVRPLLPTQKYNDRPCLSAEANQVTLAASQSLKHFQFPLVFPPNAQQQSVFQNLVQPLADDMLRGFSCAFVCSGQNGSGKSFTIEGGDSQETKGVVERLVDYLVLRLQKQQREDRTSLLRVSYVDVWQQNIVDLLEVRRGKEPRLVEKGREVELSGVGFKHVHQLNDLEDFFILGNRKRKLAYKKKRRDPHTTTSIFSVYFESCSKGRQELRRGKLHIVDLSASRVNPLPLRTSYDLSTNAFRNVAHAIVFGEGKKVPYHDSKVTLFLREFLGGFGRTNVLFHLSPAASNFAVSLESLRMAKVIGQIENYPDCQADPTQMLILKRLDELEEAREKLGEVEKRRQRLEERGEGLPEEEQNDNQNEFLSNSFVRKKKLEELEREIEHCNTQRQTLRKRIDNLHSLFLRIEPGGRHPNVPEGQSEGQKPSPYLSPQFRRQEWEVSEGNSRSNRQEVFELQKQFQEEREGLLQRIRELEKQYQFYHRVSQQAVKREELDILRHSSYYDQTKRSYQVPHFSITNKKLSGGNRFFSPHHHPTSRSFKISPRSHHCASPLSSNLNSSRGVKEIKSILDTKRQEIKSGLEMKKLEIGKRKPEKRQKLKSEVSQVDDYELGSFQRQKQSKQVSKSASSNLFRHLSRLKFK